MPRDKSNPDNLRESLTRRRLVGTFIKLPALEVLDIAASAGFDFVIVDLEHSQLSEADALTAVRHGFALDFPVIVRVAECNPVLINRLLEAGATGIQLSSVTSVAEVQRLVAATRYPPAGRRSVSLAHPVARYGGVPLDKALSVQNPLLVAQIETAKTEDPLEDIFTQGIDVAFIGVTDLAVELDLDTDRFASRVAEISGAAEFAGLALGAFASDAGSIPDGTRYVALSSDVALLRAALWSAARDGSDGS